ncbi:mitotic spindle checkpoint component mad2 [Polychaeton citri CBS 116435]|uniref:Mitotic spindle checkpoint component mad2 n=1 Tax=Polychaeton citri CBS 116435 TaxID=1314669 RepID=A0A9P4Q7X1_9PEZI|nr:mitotic spindle checkpoint component mad2 [Polychaeton citri CBS 116435]
MPSTAEPRTRTKPPSSTSTAAAAKSSTKSSRARTTTEDDKKDTHHLTLRGSSKLVTEFFEYALNSILFQRGVYPAEDFSAVKKYGLNMMVSLDDQVKSYVKKIMKQLDRWMKGGKISKLVVVVTDKEDGGVVERWQFDISIFAAINSTRAPISTSTPTDQENMDPAGVPAKQSPDSTAKTEEQKTLEQIQKEIQSLFRQITASVTFLPQLDGNCTFNVLVYADADSEVPLEWGDSDAKEVIGGEKVMLRSFSTNSHKVDTVVSYRVGE